MLLLDITQKKRQPLDLQKSPLLQRAFSFIFSIPDDVCKAE